MAWRILSAGEVLWDLLPSGMVLGGAPANVACHAAALGAESLLFSRVGADGLGREIARQMSARGVSMSLMEIDPEAPTGTVAVELNAGQPSYTICENVAWDRLVADKRALESAAQADAICFGSLVQRSPMSADAVRKLVAATPAGALRLFDINLRAPFFTRGVIEASLKLANALKLNDQELPILAEMFGPGGTMAEQAAALAGRFDLQVIAITRGRAGSLLWSRREIHEHPGLKAEVVDTVGAGDAFTAALCLGLLAKQPLAEINENANAVAAYVCSQAGATPVLPERFRMDRVVV